MTEPKPPVSPKLVLAVAWGFAVPILVAALQAGLGYLVTDDGHALFAGMPVVAQVTIYAVVGQLAAATAGYRQPDAAYRARRAQAG